MTICEYCINNLFTPPYWNPREQKHHSDLTTWQDSAKCCTICSSLLDNVTDALLRHAERIGAPEKPDGAPDVAVLQDVQRHEERIGEPEKPDSGPDPAVLRDVNGHAERIGEPEKQKPDSAPDLAVLREVLPLYSVTLQESAARDQFVLIFWPVEESVTRLDAAVAPPEPTHAELLSLPVRKFQVYEAGCDGEERARKDEPRLSPETWIDAGRNPRNRRTLRQIRTWLAECDSEHAFCREGCAGAGEAEGGLRYVPTRLVAVGSPGERHVRLVIPNGDQRFSRYASLSHCWGLGGKIAVTTTKNTIKEFQRSIALDETFPRNFGDAIEVCRALQIDYIWIDSLCIIQKDDDDWNLEAPLMHKVYGNSYLNIAAAGAHNSTEGLFRDRSINLLSPSTVPCGWQGRARTCRVIRADFWDGEVLAEPLYRRAWVSQERMLSSRTLHFGSAQLFWQCLSLAACETMPRGVPDLVASSGQEELQWRQLLARTKTRRRAVFSARDRIRLQDVWRDAVEKYTSCNMTDTKDKLPAVAGLAQVVHGICGEDYVAGMWWSEGGELVGQFAWRVKNCRDGDGKPARRQGADEYRAPSWAWPSVIHGVIQIPRRIDLRGRGYMLELLGKPELGYKDEAKKFMELTSGSVRARGIMLWLEFVDTHDPETPCWAWNVLLPGDERPWCYLYPDEPLQPSDVFRDSDRVSPSAAPPHDCGNPRTAEEATGSDGAVLPVLLLFYSQELNKCYSGRGIALSQAAAVSGQFDDGLTDMTFSRLGLVEFRELREDIFARLMAPWGSAQRDDHDDHITVKLV